MLNMKQAERLRVACSLFASKEGNKAQGKGYAKEDHPRDTLRLRKSIQNPCALLGVCRTELELCGISTWFFIHNKFSGTQQPCREMG